MTSPKPRKTAVAKAVKPAKDRPFTPKESAFISEYLVDLSRTHAAVRAGYSAKTANVKGSALMRDPRIAAAIAEAMAQRAERTEIKADDVLRHWQAIVMADPAKLTEHRRGACRYCHGDDHAYQWRDIREFAEACAKARERKKSEPTDEGGYGYNATVDPHPGCTRCDGLGLDYVHFHDVTKVEWPHRALYAGVKVTKEGIEIMTHSQEKAWGHFARHLGLDREQVDVKHSGSIALKGGGVSGLLNAAKQASDGSDSSGN